MARLFSSKNHARLRIHRESTSADTFRLISFGCFRSRNSLGSIFHRKRHSFSSFYCHQFRFLRFYFPTVRTTTMMKSNKSEFRTKLLRAYFVCDAPILLRSEVGISIKLLLESILCELHVLSFFGNHRIVKCIPSQSTKFTWNENRFSNFKRLNWFMAFCLRNPSVPSSHWPHPSRILQLSFKT